MANENTNSAPTESIADIVAEMRRFGKRHWMHDEGQNVRLYADRIEAAWERESKAIATENAVLSAVCITNRGNGDVAAKRGRESITPKPDPDWKAICAKCHDGEIEPKCEYYGEPNGCNSPIYGEHPTTEKSSAVGNAAAMREALSDATGLLESIFESFSKGTVGVYMSDVAESIDNANAALAAPPRNCDLYDSKESAQEAYKEYSFKYISAASNKFDFPMKFDDWLFAPATEQEGETDGK